MQIQKDAVGAKPHVVVLLDESGSMTPHRESVVNTFNEYVNSVRETAESISLFTFDSKGVRQKFFKKAPLSVKTLAITDYVPDAMTPLYDAMATVILQFEAGLKVQFVVHTDGQENHSKEWTYKGLNELIKSHSENGWLFVYLGEGVEGKEELAKFDGGLKMNFSAATRGMAMNAMKDVTRSYGITGSSLGSSYAKDGTLDIDKGEKVGAQ